jgi:hypothetical protein
MADVTFRLDQTGLLVVDPYNDFISDGGKLWPRIREVVEGNRCIAHMIRWCSDLLLTAPSLAPRRLRDVEILGADPGGRSSVEGLRRRHLGRDVPRRVHAATGGDRRAGALVLQRVRQYRPRSAAQEARHPPVDRDRRAREYLYRLDRSLCGGAGLRSDAGEGCHRELQLGRDEGHSRDQRPQLRPGDSLDEGADCVDPQNRRLRRNE